MTQRPTVLVAAFSARQIAASARRAGLDALAVDFFGDLDLKAVSLRGEVLRGHYPAGFAAEDLLAALERLGQDLAPIGFAYGAGFEDRPELIEAISRRWPILGNEATTLRRLKNPERFAALCAKAGVPHPEIRRTVPDDPVGWLSKGIGGAGGSHVRAAWDFDAAPDRYFQRFVAGERWSAGFIAAEGRLALLGFTRQWCAPSDTEPFRYGGAVGPLPAPGSAGELMRTQLERLVALCPLAGIGSADFVLSAEGPVLLEINPRAGATIDVFEAESQPLFGLHLDACRGRLPDTIVEPDRTRASGLAWAKEAVDMPGDFRWPDWANDRSVPPSCFAAGEPLCTVVAEAPTEAGAVALFHRRIAEIGERLGRIAT